jgi:hypothetical protein
MMASPFVPNTAGAVISPMSSTRLFDSPYADFLPFTTFPFPVIEKRWDGQFLSM